MEAVETKNKLERLAEELEAVKGEVVKSSEATKKLLVASAGLMLAGGDFISEDLIGHLEDIVPDYFAIVRENTEAAESEADATIEEAVAEPVGLSEAFAALMVRDIEGILAKTTPEGQTEVLKIVQARWPERTAEYEAEASRDQARDKLLDSVSELPMDVQTKLYRIFHVTVVDEGKEIAA